jgi:hypothetical protein
MQQRPTGVALLGLCPAIALATSRRVPVWKCDSAFERRLSRSKGTNCPSPHTRDILELTSFRATSTGCGFAERNGVRK